MLGYKYALIIECDLHALSRITTLKGGDLLLTPLLLTQDPLGSERVESNPHTQHLHIQPLNFQVQNHVFYS
jgi:hypothetical protein